MTSFTVNVPFEGQALSVYKALTDMFSHEIFSGEKVTQVSDDTITFSNNLTLGVFRLLLDGKCVTADQDFENRVTLMKLESKDRGGKGKLDANIRLSVLDLSPRCEIICECEVLVKGMLARVELPIEKVLSSNIDTLMNKILKENQSIIVIDDLRDFDVVEKEVQPEVVDLVDKDTLSALFESGNIRTSESRLAEETRPLWVKILKFPIDCILWPVNFIRDIFKSSKSPTEPIQ